MESLRIEVASVARCTRQPANNRAQHGLPDCFGCLLDREPPDLALTVLGPPRFLSQYPERVHFHLTDDNAAVLKALLIWKRSDGAPVDHSNNARLFESFPRGRTMGRSAPLRPALRDDPTSRPPRRDKHDLSAGCPSRPVRQRGVLDALRDCGRITHKTLPD
jgi:hypothetical protein